MLLPAISECCMLLNYGLVPGQNLFLWMLLQLSASSDQSTQCSVCTAKFSVKLTAHFIG